MSKYVAQSERFSVKYHKISIVFRMILIEFLHITDTRRNDKVNFGKFVTRNAGLTVAMVALEIRSAQQLL